MMTATITTKTGATLHPFLVLILKATAHPQEQDAETTQAIHEATRWLLDEVIERSDADEIPSVTKSDAGKRR